MYNILIKYNDSKSLWQLYGTSSSTTSNEETFAPFETDDLRKYLADYQLNNQCSKVTIDNVRRILSSFFAWRASNSTSEIGVTFSSCSIR